jgi:hypothetical protein
VNPHGMKMIGLGQCCSNSEKLLLACALSPDWKFDQFSIDADL